MGSKLAAAFFSYIHSINKGHLLHATLPRYLIKEIPNALLQTQKGEEKLATNICFFLY